MGGGGGNIYTESHSYAEKFAFQFLGGQSGLGSRSYSPRNAKIPRASQKIRLEALTHLSSHKAICDYYLAKLVEYWKLLMLKFQFRVCFFMYSNYQLFVFVFRIILKCT